MRVRKDADEQVSLENLVPIFIFNNLDFLRRRF